MQAINEASNMRQGFGCRIIGFERIYKLGKTINIVLDLGCLVDAVHFAKKEFMLIAIKASM